MFIKDSVSVFKKNVQSGDKGIFKSNILLMNLRGNIIYKDIRKKEAILAYISKSGIWEKNMLIFPIP